MIDSATDKVNRQMKTAGTIFKVIGALNIVSSLLGLVILISGALRPLRAISELPARLAADIFMYAMPAGLVFGLAVTAAGIGLARMQRWARALAEGLAWFFGVFIFVFAFFFAGALPSLPSPVGVFVIGFAVASILVWLIPVGLAIRWLRKAAVRQAFRGEGAHS